MHHGNRHLWFGADSRRHLVSASVTLRWFAVFLAWCHVCDDLSHLSHFKHWRRCKQNLEKEGQNYEKEQNWCGSDSCYTGKWQTMHTWVCTTYQHLRRLVVGAGNWLTFWYLNWSVVCTTSKHFSYLAWLVLAGMSSIASTPTCEHLLRHCADQVHWLW